MCEHANNVCGKISGKLFLRKDLDGKANYLPCVYKYLKQNGDNLFLSYKGGLMVFTFKILQKTFGF